MHEEVDRQADDADELVTEWTLEDRFSDAKFVGRAEGIGRAGRPVALGGDKEVLFWRASCRSSGWSGQLYPNLDQSSEISPEMVERLRQEWERHVFVTAPLIAIEQKQSEIAGLEQQLEKLKGELTDSVRDARVLNLSWAKIGEAVGISKQAAQKRWENYDPLKFAKTIKRVDAVKKKLQADLGRTGSDDSDQA